MAATRAASFLSPIFFLSAAKLSTSYPLLSTTLSFILTHRMTPPTSERPRMETKRLDSASTTPTTTPSAASSSVSNFSASSSETVTILGLGSLLSERSSRTTFPDLRNFRLGRVPNHRRVFGHPASIFFQRGIADMETKEICSLCAERENLDGNGGGPGFVCSVFEVPNDGMMEDPDGTGAFVPSAAYLEREEEFDIAMVPYNELDETATSVSEEGRGGGGNGVLCLRSTDEAYISRWGKDRFETHYGKYGIDTIWGWSRDSGIRPCGPYLRHCVLAAEMMGKICLDSFLDETFLADRETTIREYLDKNPDIMERLPPPHLAVRYGG